MSPSVVGVGEALDGGVVRSMMRLKPALLAEAEIKSTELLGNVLIIIVNNSWIEDGFDEYGLGSVKSLTQGLSNAERTYTIEVQML